jgi:serine/threonine-protein kinase
MADRELRRTVTIDASDRQVPHSRTTSERPQTGDSAAAPEQRVDTASGDPAQAIRDTLHLDARREEHAGDVIRLRKATSAGSVIWPIFFGIDLAMRSYAYPGAPLALFIGLRLLVWCIVAATALRLRRAPAPSPCQLRAIDTLIFGSASIGVALMSLPLGGLASHYGAGITVVMICRGVFVQMPWRSALLPVGVSAFSYPVTQLLAPLWSAQAAAQLHDPAALTIFVLHNLLIFTTASFLLFGGNAVWSLRRQIYEARTIDRYRLVRRIGRGGMGEVWIAHHATLRREVALKIMRPDRLHDAVSLRRFELEVRATMELSHPNTVRVLDYGITDDGLWYYAMELLAGEDLALKVRRLGPLAPASCVPLMLQICGAVAEAHQRGILHRDLKPENIFICGASGDLEYAKVLDFGIAKRFEPGQPALTQVERVVGTPEYMSPEVTLGQPVDARSDVYALGAVLYFMLTGTPPFTRRTPTAILLAHAQEQPLPPSARRGEPLPAELESVVMRCLAKAPHERYPDAGQLRDALAALSGMH